MKIIINIEIKDNPYEFSFNELKEDIVYLIRDYLSDQSTKAEIIVEIKDE